MKIVIMGVFLFASLCPARSLDDFSGKYRVKLSGNVTQSVIEFQLNAQGEPKILKYVGDEALGIPELDVQVRSVVAEAGPDVLALANLTFYEGSDEETHAYVLRLANVQDGAEYSLTLIDAIYLITDGPNQATSVEKARVTLERWSAQQRKYIKL